MNKIYFWGASKQVQCKNVQCNKFNSLQYSIIIPYTYNIFTHTNIHTIITKLHYQHFNKGALTIKQLSNTAKVIRLTSIVDCPSGIPTREAICFKFVLNLKYMFSVK